MAGQAVGGEMALEVWIWLQLVQRAPYGTKEQTRHSEQGLS